ncbi:hypothetical protein AB0F73_30015, partial [Micromonospora purpureochromogenes]|uniref:hypothetical protein n=1 Tax=Micromonospora purpureochromogenes TaxID=47872 RepID=UPI0033EF0BCE
MDTAIAAARRARPSRAENPASSSGGDDLRHWVGLARGDGRSERRTDGRTRLAARLRRSGRQAGGLRRRRRGQPSR